MKKSGNQVPATGKTANDKVMAVQEVPQHVTCASKFIHEYKFSWTVENFSISPNVIRGPIFTTIPGFPEDICIELHIKQYDIAWFWTLKVALIDLHDKDRNLTVSSGTTIRNIEDTIFTEAVISSIEFKGTIDLLDYTFCYDNTCTSKLHVSKLMNLLDDKLVVRGKLSLSEQDIASRVSSLKVNDEAKAFGELAKDFKTMYESGSASDITISVGGQTLRAHKNILLVRSPVFAKMFDNDMSECISNTVVIEDTDFHAFNCFLMFLYTGIVEDKTSDTVIALYSLTHKYQVKSLHAICSGILFNSLTIDSACSCLVFSDLHGDKVLKDVTNVFIRKNILQIAVTTKWAELVITKPQLVKEVLA